MVGGVKMSVHVLNRIDTEPTDLECINHNSLRVDRSLDWDTMKKHVAEIDLEEIRGVSAGLLEDWPCTGVELFTPDRGWTPAETTGGYFKSFWATPIFIIEYINGSTETYECYIAKERTKHGNV